MDEFRPDVKATLDGLLLGMPGVKASKAFGYPAYKINGRVFVFVGGAGIALKLPAGRVTKLLRDHPFAHPFEPVEGLVWKQWVELDRPNADDYADDIALMEEAVEYVLSA